MDEEAFTGTPGRLMSAVSTQWGQKGEPDYTYYVPPPIPRSIQLTPATQALLSEADQSIGALRYLDRIVANPHLLVAPYLRKEAVLSSRIEGTQASLSDVFQEEAQTPGPARPPDVLEVINYVHALEQGRTRVAESPITLDVVRELHRVLMQGVRGQEQHPGEFRDYQNWIGPQGTPLEQARYVPPAPEEMPDRLEDLEQFMVSPPAMPRLVQAGLIHHQFEAIHPFGDGNGRVGRLLIPLFLLQTKVLRTPLLYLSAYFERKRTEYYDRLHAVHTHGDYDGWLAFFLRGVAVQADEAAAAAGRIADLYQRYRDALTKVNATATALALLDRLFENPYVTIPQAQRQLDSSFPTVQRAIEKYLVPAGVLEHEAGTSHPRVYVAREILKAIQADS